jgi:hypothetical protein
VSKSDLTLRAQTVAQPDHLQRSYVRPSGARTEHSAAPSGPLSRGRRSTFVALGAAALAILAPPRGAHGLQAPMGQMAMDAPMGPMAMGDRAPRPAICELFSSDPVTVPASGDARAMGLAAAPYLRVWDEPADGKLVIEVGPVDVPAHGMPAQSRELVYQLAYFPLDAWVHGFQLELTDADGRAVPHRVLHHIDTTRPASRDLFLPVSQRFVALGSETGPEHLPAWLAGVPIHRGEPLLVSTMLHNPTGTPYTGVRVRLILTYTHTRPLYDVAGFRLDVMFPTGPMEYDLPPGRSVRSWEGSPQVTARLLAITGHLHRYGEWIELQDVTTGKLMWRARPRLNPAGDVTGMPVSFLRFGLGQFVYPTHRYRVTASYWNPTGRLIPEGAMAKLAGIFAPMRPLAPVDVADPMYQADLRYLLGLGCSTGGVPEMLAHAPHAHGATSGHVVH